MFGKDTDSQYNSSDGESCRHISPPQLLCFLLPLFQLYPSDEIQLFSGKTLFSWVYPGCKGGHRFLRRLVSHVCCQHVGRFLAITGTTEFQKLCRLTALWVAHQHVVKICAGYTTTVRSDTNMCTIKINPHNSFGSYWWQESAGIAPSFGN